MLKALIVGIILCVISVQTGDAQKLLHVFDTTSDYANYKHPEECLSSIGRMVDKEGIDGIDITFWADSAPLGVGNAKPSNNPVSRPVLEKFNSCVSHLSLTEAKSDSLIGRWVKLLGALGNTEEIDQLTKDWISSAPHDSIKEFREKLALEYRIDVTESYRPLNVNRLYALYAKKMAIAHDTSKLWERRRQLRKWITLYGLTGIKDTVSFKLEESAHILSDAAKDSVKWRRDEYGRALIQWAVEVRDDDAVMDSLRLSAQSYLNIRKNHYKFATGIDSVGSDDLPMRIGVKAPSLVGEWFFSGDGTGGFREIRFPNKIPDDGKVTLILFASGYHDKLERDDQFAPRLYGNTSKRGFWYSYPILRRLQRDYPEIEIVLVTHTIGYFINGDAISPEVEASKIAQYWLGENRLRASLVVNNTDYFTLPAPDRRRIDRDDPNQKAYWYYVRGKLKMDMPAGGFVLVHSDGTVVYKNKALIRTEGATLQRMIDALLRK